MNCIPGLLYDLTESLIHLLTGTIPVSTKDLAMQDPTGSAGPWCHCDTKYFDKSKLREERAIWAQGARVQSVMAPDGRSLRQATPSH